MHNGVVLIPALLAWHQDACQHTGKAECRKDYNRSELLAQGRFMHCTAPGKGFGNQIEGVVRSACLAAWLNATLVLPRLRTAPYDRPRDRRVDFSYLFDVPCLVSSMFLSPARSVHRTWLPLPLQNASAAPYLEVQDLVLKGTVAESDTRRWKARALRLLKKQGSVYMRVVPWILSTSRDLSIKRSVLEGLKPSQRLRGLADVIMGVCTSRRKAADAPVVGLHLRMESDVRSIPGGENASSFPQLFLQRLRMHYSPTARRNLVVYLSSGEFPGRDAVIADLRTYVGDVVTKELALAEYARQSPRCAARAKEALGGLREREVKAALEHAVLRKTHVFFGMRYSSFSSLLAIIRCLQNPPARRVSVYYDTGTTVGAAGPCTVLPRN